MAKKENRVEGEETIAAEQETALQPLIVVEEAVYDIFFGAVTLIVQDSRIIQIEKLEKIRLCETNETKKTVAKENAGLRSSQKLRERVAEAVQGLQYGKVLIQIQARQVVQIERTEKYRVGKMSGMYGDGI